MFSLLQRNIKATEKFSTTHQGYVLNVVLKRRHNAKRMTIRVRDGEIHATTPKHIDARKAERFILDHFDWVKAQLDQDASVFCQSDNESPGIWYKGNFMPVQLAHDPDHKGRSQIKVGDDEIIIFLSPSSRLRPSKILEEWMKKQARQEIKSSLNDVLPELGEAPVPISIRDQKTRWGSCSTTRRLSFNWRLIMAPPAALHYVVVHEAVHLIHHDHSSRFWGKVAEMMPDYRDHKNWLNTHQKDLFASIDRRLMTLKPSRLY